MSDIEEQRKYYERMMDDVGAEYRERIVNLQDENAELREQVANLIDRSFQMADKMRCLNDENAKLRELVRHMRTCLEHYEPGDTISCEQCPYDNETWGCDCERLMAELGVDA